MSDGNFSLFSESDHEGAKLVITGVVLARNEQTNIVACLEPFRPHVGELLLIDMESGDRTVELARPLVDRVLGHPLVANFDAARNIAIAEAKFDWLWFIDADERVSEATGRLVNQLVRERGREFVALNIPFMTHFCGAPIMHSGWWPGYTMPRVLKRPHFKFSERLHGGVEVDGPQLFLPPDPNLAIQHYSYLSVDHYLTKLNRYTSTEAQQILADGGKYSWQANMRHMARDLWMYYEANEGKLDGARGWILSWLSGQYRWLSHAKVWDLGRQKEVRSRKSEVGGETSEIGEDERPESIDEALAVVDDEIARLRAKRPQLPLGIVWRSPLRDASGYADDGRTMLKALASGERSFSACEIRWNNDVARIAAGDQAVLNATLRARRPRHAVAITSCIPTLVEPDPLAALNVLRTMFETDRIPADWLPQIAKFDEVWVLSQHNREAFVRSGAAPERIRVAPGCIDTDLFSPGGERLELPEALAGRFVFLSVFDWQLRKGWDLLLRGYVRAFSPAEPVGLLLKVSRAHGHPESLIRQQADQLLAQCGTSLGQRPEIVFAFDSFDSRQMNALYRSASAFVLPTRGEGWGRPFMEAMATGLPVIGTAASGNSEFMNESNSFVLSTKLIDIPEEAAREIPPYRGHRWYEPDEGELVETMRRVVDDGASRERIARQGLNDVRTKFNLDCGRRAIEDALQAGERRLMGDGLPRRTAHTANPRFERVRVEWEGELFAGHSFSNINERLASELAGDERLALRFLRREYNPTYDAEAFHAARMRRLLHRDLPGGPEVTVRHSYPPNWNPPQQGLWVHIQPWEFGHLPVEWIAPLRDQVDEIWAPSHYVRKVYERSGVPAEKIQVIPWGVDPDVFNPRATPRLLPTRKSFRFLFVGGTIYRKGFDLLLQAYLDEFSPADDVSLVVKDMGGATFYRYGNCRDQILAAQSDPSKPEIVYLEDQFTEGQLASLYTACHALVAPYRGEGFGLPILEAMACGLPPIVTSGGASDDFTDVDTAFLLPSNEIIDSHPMPLCGPALALVVEVAEIRRQMRYAYEHREEVARRGRVAANRIRSRFTWENTAERMAERLCELVSNARERAPNNGRAQRATNVAMQAERMSRAAVTACLAIGDDEAHLGECLARVRPFVDRLLVVANGSNDRSAAIAREYGANLIEHGNGDGAQPGAAAEARVETPWYFWIRPTDCLAEDDGKRMRAMLADASLDLQELGMKAGASRLVDEQGRPLKTLRLFRNGKEPAVESAP